MITFKNPDLEQEDLGLSSNADTYMLSDLGKYFTSESCGFLFFKKSVKIRELL